MDKIKNILAQSGLISLIIVDLVVCLLLVMLFIFFQMALAEQSYWYLVLLPVCLMLCSTTLYLMLRFWDYISDLMD